MSKAGRNVDRAARLWRGAAVVLAAGVWVIACADAPPPEPGARAQPLTTATLCNSGAGSAPFTIRLAETFGGNLPATTVATYIVKNPTSSPLRIRVDLRSYGLDSRQAARTLWEGYVGANATTQKSFALNKLPIQTQAGKGISRLIATVTAAANQEHLIGVSNVSSALATKFGTGYTTVLVSGSDVTAPTSLDNPADVDQLAQQLAPLALSLAERKGRIWNGTAFDDVQTLPPTGDGNVYVGQTVLLGNNDSLSISSFGGPSDNAPFLEQGGFKVCAFNTQDYLDDGRGEAVVASTGAASYMAAQMFEMNPSNLAEGKQIWSGFLDANGCSPRLGVISGRPYSFSLETGARRPDGAQIVARDGSPLSTATELTYFSVANVPLDGAPAVANVNPLGFVDDHRAAAITALVRVLGSSRVYVEPHNYNVRFGYCRGLAKGQNGAWTACGDGDVLWLGPNEDGTHNTQWKYVIAHEFGHLIQNQLNAAVDPLYADGTNATAPAACTCDHVPDFNEQSHCLQSREYLAGVENEGYAHGIAAATFGGDAATACKFVYYKEVRDGSTIRKPPFAVNCAAPVRWMENNCLVADRGVEWDWLNWQRAMDVNTNRIDNRDFAAVYANACGGSCSGSAPSVAQLKTAAIAVFGAGTKADAFANLASANGTNH